MITPNDAQELIGRTAVDAEGDKVGEIGQVYLDPETGQPRWVTVATGLFGTRQTFAPVYGAQFDSDQVVLAVSKELIMDAPDVDDDTQLTEGEQDALYQHYAGHLGA